MVQLFLSNDKTGWSWAAGINTESGGRLVGAAAEDIRRVGVRAHGVRTVKSAYLEKWIWKIRGYIYDSYWSVRSSTRRGGDRVNGVDGRDPPELFFSFYESTW